MFPDKTEIELTYHATLGKWEGTLFIPTNDPDNPDVFHCVHATSPMHAWEMLRKAYELRQAKIITEKSRQMGMPKSLFGKPIVYVPGDAWAISPELCGPLPEPSDEEPPSEPHRVPAT